MSVIDLHETSVILGLPEFLIRDFVSSHPVVGGVFVVVPQGRETCFAGLGGALCQALLIFPCAQEVDEIINFCQPLGR